MKKTISYMAISAMLFGIIPGTAMAQTTPDQDPPQYGIPFKNVPDRRDVSMYQVNMRSFSKDGNFKGVIARLDSIKTLGVNVVYILPIYPVGVLKAQGSPYSVKDYRKINTEFGTLDDLRALVDGVHKRKMAIIIDWVGNHTSWDNPWIVNKDWYEQDSTGNIKHAQTWRDVAQLNFKNTAMCLTMIKDMKYWVLTANIDGFRCDYADGPPADFWKQAIDTLRNIPTHKLLFLAEGTRSENFNAGFDYNFGFRFFENLKEIYKDGKTVKSIDTINIKDYTNATDGQQMVRYITNHDVNSSDGSPIQLFGGKKGSMAAFVIAAYMKGVPMIYDGQEVGTPYPLVFPFTNSKIDWSLNPDVTAEYKKVIAFRNGSEAIRRGELTSYSSDDVCAFTKILGEKAIFVLSNLRNTDVSYTIPSNLLGYKWKDGFTGVKSKLSSTITLAPYQYIVLKN
jgi:glycosidase